MVLCASGGLAIALGLGFAPNSGAAVVVPQNRATTDGNSSNSFPFSCQVFGITSQHYQQVYLGTEIGTGTIKEIRLRQDASTGSGFGPTTLADVTVRLSSTTAAPDGLSATFAANVGPDVATVLSADLVLSSPASTAVPRPFNIVIPFTTPFAFDGASGANLLLDVTIPTCASTTQFDAENSPDSVSRAYTSFSGAGSATADARDSAGLVTQFIFVGEPLCGDGIVDAGEQCDDGNTLNGDCCSATCQLEPSGTLCRASVNACDPPEFCSGSSPTCPADVIEPDSDGDGVCDPLDNCPGVTNPAQEDADGDGIGDVCDNCPFVPNPSQGDPSVCAPQPHAKLTSEELDLFQEGLSEFAQVEPVEEGLGPIFNGSSCAECHSAPTVGGSSARLETRFGRTGPSGFDPMTAYGGSLIQAQGITTGSCSVAGEMVPPEATIIAQRQTTPLFGLGLVDAIPDAAILARADPDDRDGDGISGRPNLIGPRVGRFGWKAQVATLHDFAGDAYLNEMGVTSPGFPNELSPNGGPVVCDTVPDPEDAAGTNVTAFTDFMTLLAPLPTAPRSRDVRLGRMVFRHLRCGTCHYERYRTAPSAVVALSRRRVPVFSDLLLHDMGPGLADGIEQGQATGSEFRTAPLWGVGKSGPYLHDGRATTLAAAIAAHGGEAQAARDAFLGLTPGEQALLIAYLDAL
jgi:cysteine-rich repeat protein